MKIFGGRWKDKEGCLVLEWKPRKSKKYRPKSANADTGRNVSERQHEEPDDAA